MSEDDLRYWRAEYNVSTENMMPATARKERRIQLRASQREVAEISRAAAVSGMSVSAFIMESASERAQRTLADQRHFELKPAQWEAFATALDRPARQIRALEKLIEERSVLERR